MTTCFLFAEQLDEERCLSLSLDESGQVIAPPEKRSFDDIQALKIKARTMVVVPTERVSIHVVELPWLSERRARAALPYALEEQLAQPVSSLHFAFDRAHYQNQRYLVLVLDKQYLIDLIQSLESASLSFDAITIDWFAVQPNQVILTQKSLLVHESSFKGALDGELIEAYLEKHSLNCEILCFANSNPAHLETYEKKEGPVQLFIAQQLLRNKFINLLQGEFYQDTTKDSAKFWYQVSGVVFILWLISIPIIDAIQVISLNKKISVIDAQTAVIYKEFFPDAQHVISPKFRIMQLLKNSTSLQGEEIWLLLDKIAPALQKYPLEVQQFRFQNHTLSITLNAKDFEILENLQLRLKKEGVKVTQTQASSQDNQVIATLELNL